MVASTLPEIIRPWEAPPGALAPALRRIASLSTKVALGAPSPIRPSIRIASPALPSMIA